MLTIAPGALQTTIAEELQLLRMLNYLPLSKERFRYINKQHLMLDVIATVFATGSGDLFAAVFNPNENKVILAKNGDPAEADISFANDFFAFIIKPEAKRPVDLFSFLLQHRPGGLNKRIRQVHDAVVDPRFCATLDSALEELGPDNQLEFHRGHRFIGENFKGEDSVSILRSCRDIILEQTQKAFDETVDLSARSRIYATIINAADVIAHCSIMESCFDSAWARKVRMHGIKAFRYLHIVLVFRAAKRRLSSGEPITHRWVGDIQFIGSGGGEIQLDSKTPREVMHRWFKYISRGRERTLDCILPRIDKKWQTTLHASIHPEIRLIFGLFSDLDDGSHPIGLSKRSCLACAVWLESFKSSGIEWEISDCSCRKPDEHWAVPGNVDLVGEAAMTNVVMELRARLSRVVSRDTLSDSD